jgi:hypothetical protein
LLKDETSQLISEHYGCITSHTAIFSKSYGEDMFRCPYKDYSSLNMWQANRVYILPLLYAIYYSIMMQQGKKVSILPLGGVNPGPIPSRRGFLEDSPYRVVGVACLSCDWSRPCT